MRTLDLFCGAGGSSEGARQAGATVVAGVDAWGLASRTFGKNFPDATAINLRLEGTKLAPAVRKLRDIQLLLASPECTSHTCARGSREKSEASRLTAMQVLHHADHFKPRWIIVENVIQMRSWSRYPEFLKRLQKTYEVSEQVLDASDFGVPQSRRRLFLICGRDHEPVLIHAHGGRARAARRILDPAGSWRTTPLKIPRRAEATLERAERAIAEVGRSEPFLLVYYGTDGGGGWQDLDRPLRTITTVDRFALVTPSSQGHMMRMLQVPELKRAMGLPDSYLLAEGTRRERIMLLGNGVCPPVMAALVSSIRAQERARARKPAGPGATSMPTPRPSRNAPKRSRG